MMWMSTHESAPPWTLQVWKHLLTLLASYSMLGLLKRSMSLVALYSCDCWREVWVWWLCILMIDEFGGSVFSWLMSLVALYSHDWWVWWLCILTIGILNFWWWPLVVLVVVIIIIILRQANQFPFKQSSTKIELFSPIICWNYNVVTTCELSFNVYCHYLSLHVYSPRVASSQKHLLSHPSSQVWPW